MRSTNKTTKGWCVMDGYDGGVFYKKEIEKLIEGSEDIDLLDLVYKILVEAKK